jgi:predicted nucleic acid-binding protein
MLLDTSAIVEIFRSPSESANFARLVAEIGEEEVYISAIQLAEITDWAIKNSLPPQQRIDAVKELARMVQLDEQICLDAATIKHRRQKDGYKDFGLIDGLILATARSLGQRLLTFDEDFVGENDCLVIS